MELVYDRINKNVPITERIDTLARWVIVCSYIYYDRNFNIVPDKYYDENARHLAELIKTYPEDAVKCKYWYVIYDFDGTTGFDLYDRLSEPDKDKIMVVAFTVLRH